MPAAAFLATTSGLSTFLLLLVLVLPLLLPELRVLLALALLLVLLLELVLALLVAALLLLLLPRADAVSPLPLFSSLAAGSFLAVAFAVVAALRFAGLGFASGEGLGGSAKGAPLALDRRSSESLPADRRACIIVALR